MLGKPQGVASYEGKGQATLCVQSAQYRTRSSEIAFLRTVLVWLSTRIPYQLNIVSDYAIAQYRTNASDIAHFVRIVWLDLKSARKYVIELHFASVQFPFSDTTVKTSPPPTNVKVVPASPVIPSKHYSYERLSVRLSQSPRHHQTISRPIKSRPIKRFCKEYVS